MTYAERRGRIIAWARSTRDRSVEDAAGKLAAERLGHGPDRTGAARTLNREIAAERTLFYRRVLAAWVFLLNLNEQAALEQLHRTIELERTPLPAVLARLDAE